MMKIFLTFLFFTNLSYAKEVALTIDDVPLGDGILYSGTERTEKFIKIFKKENIQAAFFCNSVRLEQSNGMERIKQYTKAGHIVANHTHSHLRLSKTLVHDYLSDFDKADNLLNKFSTFKKWFRFPYLNEGSSIEQRDQVRKHLQDFGYINAFVTVDNYDYVIDDFLKKAIIKKLKVNLQNACEMLSDLVIDGLEGQRDLSIKQIGKDLPQVLLMHENDIEAYCIDQTIQTLKSKGWQIIPPNIPYQDPILIKEPDTLWLDQGRIAAIVAAKTGTKFKPKWDNMSTLKSELNRRKIVEGLDAN